MGSVIHVHTGGAIGKRGLWRHSDGVSSRYRYQNQGLVDVPDPSDKIISNTLKSYCCKAAGIYTARSTCALLLATEPSHSVTGYHFRM